MRYIKPSFLDACRALQPEDFFVIRGDEIVHFEDKSGKGKPTKETVEAKLKELEAEYDAKKYQRDRETSYPNIQDVVVALAEKEEGDDTMWKEITAKRQKVKADNPKPE